MTQNAIFKSVSIGQIDLLAHNLFSSLQLKHLEVFRTPDNMVSHAPRPARQILTRSLPARVRHFLTRARFPPQSA
jgi:hypothetical protein